MTFETLMYSVYDIHVVDSLRPDLFSKNREKLFKAIPDKLKTKTFGECLQFIKTTKTKPETVSVWKKNLYKLARPLSPIGDSNNYRHSEHKLSDIMSA